MLTAPPAEGWAPDPTHRATAFIPGEMIHQGKTDLALAVIDEALRWGAYSGVVLADEPYGGSFEWRTTLRQRSLRASCPPLAANPKR